MSTSIATTHRFLPQALGVSFLVTVAVLAFSATAAGQNYMGIDLYIAAWPPGDPFQVSAASAGQLVGASLYSPVIGPPGPQLQLQPDRALLWKAPAGEVVDLTPSGFSHAEALGTNGTQQVGRADTHAMLWSGMSDSAVDLHPINLSGIDFSVASGIGGGQQVGRGITTEPSNHAILWNGTADSAVDLHPTNLSGFVGSVGYGTDGTRQVGYAHPNTTLGQHAVLWNGTADSAVDLHPTNLSEIIASIANGVSGVQQVGYGFVSDGRTHALLWNGTADSGVDLHPTILSGFSDSTAHDTDGMHQVGFARGDEIGQHALLWSGTADSALDLNTLLPFTATSSTAYSIDAQGNVFGTAVDSEGNIHAVQWSPIPEPSTLALAALGVLGLFVRKYVAKPKSQQVVSARRQRDFPSPRPK